MKRKKHLRLLIVLLIFICWGCVISKSRNDRSEVEYARKNTDLIKELAEYAIIFCRENKITSFETDNIANRAVRKKMSHFGQTVTVIYGNSGYPIDSVVTFKFITISFGVKETIYDFASRARNFGDDTTNRKERVFLKIADRVYYARRPFPMM